MTVITVQLLTAHHLQAGIGNNSDEQDCPALLRCTAVCMYFMNVVDQLRVREIDIDLKLTKLLMSDAYWLVKTQLNNPPVNVEKQS